MDDDRTCPTCGERLVWHKREGELCPNCDY